MKNLICQKGQKKPNFIWPFFKNKKTKGVEKSQKLQIWPQKSQAGNPDTNNRQAVFKS